MLRSGFTTEVDAVDWASLRSTYGSGEVVRDILLGLAARDEAIVKMAWEQIGETVLQHQGTVYPATAAAAPFLCQIALDRASLWREALTVNLARLATGYDEPYAPAGTARAVRDAVRPYVGDLLGQWGSSGDGLDMALVVLSAAFPVEASAITAQLTAWFARSEPPVRTALGLALAFHGLADPDSKRIVDDEVGKSIHWVVRAGGLIMYTPGQSGSPKPEQEPYISSSVPEAIQLAESLRAGADERAVSVSALRGFVSELSYAGGRHLIDYPD